MYIKNFNILQRFNMKSIKEEREIYFYSPSKFTTQLCEDVSTTTNSIIIQSTIFI